MGKQPKYAHGNNVYVSLCPCSVVVQKYRQDSPGTRHSNNHSDQKSEASLRSQKRRQSCADPLGSSIQEDSFMLDTNINWKVFTCLSSPQNDEFLTCLKRSLKHQRLSSSQLSLYKSLDSSDVMSFPIIPHLVVPTLTITRCLTVVRV